MGGVEAGELEDLMMDLPTGDQNKLLDTELQVTLQALDAYRLPWGPEEDLRQRARRKVAAQLELAQRPYRETAKR